MEAAGRLRTAAVIDTDPQATELELARLRREEPVSWRTGPRGAGWVVTRHADVAAALGAPELFSSERGTTEPLYPDGDPAAGSMLAVTDPPRHTEIRDVVRRAMDRQLTDETSDRIRHTVRRSLAHSLAGDRDDVAAVVARQLSVETLADLFAVPAADRDRFSRLSGLAFAADNGTRAQRALRAEANMEIIEYFVELAGRRDRCPGDDFVSALGVGGLTARQAGLNCFNLLAGATETTRSMVGGLLAMLTGEPSVLCTLRDQADSIDLAVEEVIRWTSPVRRVLRVCTRDTVFAGQRILAGDAAALWIVSANRDERVFPDPAAIRFDRSPNPHLGFGNGNHECVGLRIARLELSELIGELIRMPDEVIIAPSGNSPARIRLLRP